MYTITAYETENGNILLEDFYNELKKKHKDNRIQAIYIMIERLRKYGEKINLLKRDTLKKLDDSCHLWELRINDDRIFIWHDESNSADKFVLLHGYEKNSQEIPKNELSRAKNECRSYSGRSQ